MRLIMAFIAMAALAYAYAESSAPTGYERAYLACAEFGAVALTEKQKESCHESAKSAVVSSFQMYQRLVDCMGYDHSPESVDRQKEVQCLKFISKN